MRRGTSRVHGDSLERGNYQVRRDQTKWSLPRRPLLPIRFRFSQPTVTLEVVVVALCIWSESKEMLGISKHAFEFKTMLRHMFISMGAVMAWGCMKSRKSQVDLTEHLNSDKRYQTTRNPLRVLNFSLFSPASFKCVSKGHDFHLR